MSKIVHIIHRDAIGGGETMLAQHLRYYGKKYDTCVLHGGRGLVSRTCEELGIQHIQIPLETKLKSIPGFFHILWHLRQLKPDLLILHGQWGGPLGAIAGKILGIQPMLYVIHWPSFYTDWDIYRVVRNFFSEWFPVHFCHRLIALSNASRYQYMIRFPNSDRKMVVLCNMVELSKIPGPEVGESIRREFHWSPDCVHVVSVCRMATQKRIDWLIKSWKIVQDSGVNARLWLVGGGELLSRMQELARLEGIEKSCTFLGLQQNGINFIRAGDIAAMTSMYEGNSLVPMEVMACGKPIVASGVDGVRDTFTHGEEGFLVPPGDIQKFAQCLITLIRDSKLREQMGQKGLVSCRQYDSNIVLERFVALYENELHHNGESQKCELPIVPFGDGSHQ